MTTCVKKEVCKQYSLLVSKAMCGFVVVLLCLFFLFGCFCGFF